MADEREEPASEREASDLVLLGISPRRTPVPAALHSFLRRGPFETCLMCERRLLERRTHYFIEKAIRGDEVIFEYAICERCWTRVDEEISKESMERIRAFYEEQGLDLFQRRVELAKCSPRSIDPWIDRCVVTGQPREECAEYQLYAECEGENLLLSHAPFMIGGQVLDRIPDLLSERTKGWLEDFIDEYLGLPPELKGWAKDRLLVV